MNNFGERDYSMESRHHLTAIRAILKRPELKSLKQEILREGGPYEKAQRALEQGTVEEIRDAFNALLSTMAVSGKMSLTDIAARVDDEALRLDIEETLQDEPEFIEPEWAHACSGNA